MDFQDVLRRRRMVRTFEPRPVDPEALERILWAAQRAPSAGYSQGYAFLVLDRPEDVERFWSAAAHGEDEWPGDGLRRAPVVILPVAGKHVYLNRYAEPDKGWSDRDEARWPVPYWTVDASFAAMLIQLAAIDQGLGALFFGLDAEGYGAVWEAFGVPGEWEPLGAIAIGHPATKDDVRSSAHSRPRKAAQEVAHRGRWHR